MGRNLTISMYLLLCSAISIGCMHNAIYPNSDTLKSSSELVGKSYWLKQSLYGGQFWDDDRVRLAHARPFDTLKLVKTLDGDVIIPAKENEIIPCGTRAYIEKIQWPSTWSKFKRPLLSPRNQAWAYVKFAMDRGNVTLQKDKTYILLVPQDIRDAKGLKTWFQQLFSSNDPNYWLLSLSKPIRNGITNKHPVIGMNMAQLVAAMGNADQLILKTSDSESNFDEIAIFSQSIVRLRRGKVASITRTSPK